MAPSGFLKSVELRLLRCTLIPSSYPSPSPTTHHSDPLRSIVESLLASIERGDYSDALSSPDAVRLVFSSVYASEFDDSLGSAAQFYGQVELSVESFLEDGSEAWLEVLGDESDAAFDAEGRLALVLCLAIAALLAFTQQNVTGPVGEFSPFPLQVPGWMKGREGEVGGEWDVWARNKLTSVGADLLGKISLLQYLAYSQILLRMTKDLSRKGRYSFLDGVKSISWWWCRLTLLHQRILDELSSSLYDQLHVFKNETLLQFGELDNVFNYWGSMIQREEALTIASTAQLEAGIIEYKYGRVDSSSYHLSRAEVACGLDLSLTGALGFRTIHQLEPKGQMVLVANTGEEKHGDRNPKEASEAQSGSAAYNNKSESHSCGHYDHCDILMRPRLVENGNKVDFNEDTLTAAQQAVVLAQCLHLKRQNRNDELLGWEMAPYIEAIDAQEKSYYIIKHFCDILRIRWESTRSRTKQRALLMMDKMVEVVYEASPRAAQRIQFAFAVYVPTISALRKEYGELLVSHGLSGEAIKIFEDLELWDNLIYCYRLLEKKAAAVDLIKARLSDTPTDSRLWCSLGDVTNNDMYYEKALEVSNNKSARAKRSLARSAYNRGDYEKSKALWESAMAQNSLYPNGWFALGAAALKARDIDKAIDGFTRAVQLDPENGEAWNNIACLHMLKRKNKESFVAFKEALKFRRNSWQLWENYGHVAFDIGNFGQALEAIKMVLDLSSSKRVDVELLTNIMEKVEEKSFKAALSFHVPESCNSETDTSCPSTEINGERRHSESLREKPRETELLVDMLGSILQQVIRTGGSEDIWGLYARWHKMKGNLSMCSEALLKQVRSYQGSELWHDLDRFRKFARASLQLCKVYIAIASSTGSTRELSMAEMHLRSSVKQAAKFSDTEEFRDLQACLDEVRKQLNPASTGGA